MTKTNDDFYSIGAVQYLYSAMIFISLVNVT